MNCNGKAPLKQLKPIPAPRQRTITYEYNITDQLGNIRMVFNHKGEILQENHYYPFGMVMNSIGTQNGNNPYFYNGKELQDLSQFYDYGFRQLDPQLGRWFCVDKLAEWTVSVSPYAYVSNNPINHYDILGLADDGLVNPGFPDDTWAMILAGADEAGWGDNDEINETYSGSYLSSKASEKFHSKTLIVGFRRNHDAGNNIRGWKWKRRTFNWWSYDYNPPDNNPWSVHTVVKGESIWGLSGLYNVSIEDILLVNPNIEYKWGTWQKGKPNGTDQYVEYNGSYCIYRPEIYIDQEINIPDITSDAFKRLKAQTAYASTDKSFLACMERFISCIPEPEYTLEGFSGRAPVGHLRFFDEYN